MLDVEVLPNLTSCCSLSFDAIAVIDCIARVARRYSGKDMKNIVFYFFVRDECLISLTKTKLRVRGNQLWDNDVQ